VSPLEFASDVPRKITYARTHILSGRRSTNTILVTSREKLEALVAQWNAAEPKEWRYEIVEDSGGAA
jgi:hypothetical protein